MPNWTTSFEAHAQRLLDTADCPGLAVGVAINGEPVYLHGFGCRDREQELPVTPDTIFGLASVTKSFTCVAIMRLQEEGKLRVHDPVANYIPEFRPQGITIHHLMTHTSGLPGLSTSTFARTRSILADPHMEGTAQRRLVEGRPPIDTYEQLVEEVAASRFELLGAPGTQFNYSNEGFAMLGLIIQRVSGISYEEYVADRILRPAGMSRTMFDLEQLTQMENVTTLYTPKEIEGRRHVLMAPIWWDAPALSATGRLRSTVRDLLRYLEIYRTGGMVGDQRILRPESVNAMMTPQVQLPSGEHYGYGLAVNLDVGGVVLVGHGGSITGVSSQVYVVPSKGITAVGLTNLTGVPISKILLGAVQGALGLPVGEPLRPSGEYPCPPERLREYAGSYHSDEGGMDYTFEADDDTLYYRVGEQGYGLVPIGPDAFGTTILGGQVSFYFLRNEAGAVRALFSGVRQIARVAPAAAS